MADAAPKTTPAKKTAAPPRDTSDDAEAAAAGAAYAESRIAHLASIGLAVGRSYKSVWHGTSYLGGVKLIHIVIDQHGDQSALVFQTDGVKDAAYQVVILDKLAQFTLA